MRDESDGWPAQWAQQREGEGCVLCGRSDIDDDEWGVRVFSGSVVDGFVWRTGLIQGYVVAVWNGPHVSEPTHLSSDQAATYWQEITRLGRAVEDCFDPAKMNYLTLGNNVPHLHTHIVPRPWTGDPDPHGPVDFKNLDAPRQPDGLVQDTVQRLRHHLG